jgi:hypothetical protein
MKSILLLISAVLISATSIGQDLYFESNVTATEEDFSDSRDDIIIKILVYSEEMYIEYKIMSDEQSIHIESVAVIKTFRKSKDSDGTYYVMETVKEGGGEVTFLFTVLPDGELFKGKIGGIYMVGRHLNTY